MIFKKLSGLKNNNVIKASTWYIVCSFMTNAMNFITAPVFTRIMPQEAYGEYNNFISWYGIISCVVGLNLSSTIMRAQYDFKDEFNSYITSMMLLATVHAAVLYIVAWIFQSRLTGQLNMNMFYITLIFICSLFQVVNGIFQAIQRLNYKYKVSAFLTFISVLLTSVVSVILVICWRDKLFAKIIGSQVPALIINIGLFIYFLTQWKRPRLVHWKYAYMIAFPFIPHLLAGNMLSSLDRVMITDLKDVGETAIYSVAGNCVSVLSIFSTSINAAIQPWLVERLHKKEYLQIKKRMYSAAVLFTLICCYMVIFSKEIIFIMGGTKYSAAVVAMPPLVFGCLFQYIYTFYVSVEQFEAKTVGMAVATMATALLNWGLNRVFIPQYGYIAAAYTTMVSYLFLLVIHYLLVRSLKLQMIFDTKSFIGLFLVFGVFSIIVSRMNDYIRYGIIVVMTGSILWLAVKMLQTIR